MEPEGEVTRLRSTFKRSGVPRPISSDLESDVPDEKEHEYIVTKEFPELQHRESQTSRVEDLTRTQDLDDDDFLLNGRASVLIFSSIAEAKKERELSLEDFKIVTVLGQGAFGKVYLTVLKETEELYAIKAIRKDILIETDQIESTKLERDILLQVDHPFLCGMDFVFQTDLRLYFVMPFIRGGELYKHHQKYKRFPEEVVKFYAYQIAIAIGHLHSKGIAHRDLKLENILLQDDGYIKVIDFGLAKILKDGEETMTFCGTPEYLAPEMVRNEGHTFSVDWWALGVLVYEMMVGISPFYNRNRNQILEKIKRSRVVFPDPDRFKIHLTDDCKDFILSLLDKEPRTRLGSISGVMEVLAHPWFNGTTPDEILKKKITPPIKLNLSDEFDTKYFNTEAGKSLTETIIPRAKIAEIQEKQVEFSGFDSGFNMLKKE